MDDGAWNDGELRVLGVYISRSVHTPDSEKMDGLFMLFNAGGDCEISLPEVNGIDHWQRLVETGADDAFEIIDVDSPITLYRESVAVFAPKGATEPPKEADTAERRRWFNFGRKPK